ncbi:hypothetical protein P3T39_004363 [Kitasatospora sp. GP82]|nr:hypothetical protein [Kitasatospora sp. GP82]
MSLTFHWFLPTCGDSRHIVGGGHDVAAVAAGAGGASGEQCPAIIGHLAQIATTVEQLGFEGVPAPTGVWCEDAWMIYRHPQR